MFYSIFLYIFCVVKIGIVFSQDVMFYPDNDLVIGNLRKRDVIPLNPFYTPRRRYGDQPNLNYRRTRDIRDDFVDRRFEMSESQLMETKLLENKEKSMDKLHNELRWLSMDTEEDQQPNMLYIGQ